MYSLDNVIREKYSSLNDTLRDMEDALRLIALLANFPQSLELKNTEIYGL